MEKTIDQEAIEAMKEDNQGYCTPEYCYRDAKKTHEEVAKRITNLLNIKKVDTCLDVGCGFGDLTIAMGKYAGMSYGVDCNEKFIDVCRRKNRRRRNLVFLNRPSEKLPFERESINLIVSKTVLEHVDDVDKTLSEMARVITKRGIVYIECPNYMWFWEGHYKVPMIPMMPKPLFKLYLKLIGRPTGFLDGINYVTPNQIEKVLKSKGLLVVNLSDQIMRKRVGYVLSRIMMFTQLYPTIIIKGVKI